MKRSICFLLIAVLLLSVGFTTSYADSNKHFTPPGLAKKGGLPPGIAKKFIDIDGYNWAKNALDKMVNKGILSGISENLFAPSRNVTKLEALVMIIRTMEWGDDAETALDLIKKGKKADKLKNKLQDWGKGYIDVALDRGLIDEVDLWQQNFTTPATREDVAKYIIRALGWQEKAEKYMDETLRFKDAPAVSMGAVGYIYLVDKEKIMTGYPDHTFRPNQPVKRIEMAQLVANLDEMLNEDEDDEIEVFKGKITKIDLEDKEIVVKIGSREKLFEVIKNTVIRVNGKNASLKDLYKGMDVEVTVEEDEVIKVYAKSIKNEEEIFKGKITKIDLEDKEIVVKIGSREKLFEVTKNTVIRVNGKNASFKDLYKGMDVEVTVEEDEVIKVYAESTRKEYVGKIVEKVEGTVNKLTLRIDGENKTYTVDKNVIIEIENDENDDEIIIEYKTFKDLEIGSKIRVTIENNVIVEIKNS